MKVKKFNSQTYFQLKNYGIFIVRIINKLESLEIKNSLIMQIIMAVQLFKIIKIIWRL